MVLPNGDNGHGNETQSSGDAAQLVSGSLASGDAPLVVAPHEAARDVPIADAGERTSTSGNA